ncbi:hypothetical protein [Flavobacterium sp.]|uniref:hypothetical protein n=1 Tax=Flavobacterium sp. TaxID=239 RepID=UPI0024896271|nr:hypothetical protein [Flavobacterium sp.]MDI1317561.1 hypothetical protein [Flavobacterium sp.]
MKKLCSIFAMVLLTFTISCNNDENVANPITQNPVDVYVAGQKNNQACYWKNNQLVVLDPGSFTGSAAKKIIVSNDDVYVLGTAFPTGGSNYGPNLYWKNGVLTNLNALFFTESLDNFLYVSDMDVVGSDVYFVGFTKNFATNAFSLKTWKNNVATDLINNNTTNANAEVCKIKVQNNEIYVTTPSWGVFVNTVSQSVPSGVELKGIAGNNNQITIYGRNSNSNTVYYKNLSTNLESNSSVIQDVEKLMFDNNNLYFSSLFGIYKNSILGYSIPQTDIIKTFTVVSDNLYTIEGSNSQIVKINNVITMTATSNEVYNNLYID